MMQIFSLLLVALALAGNIWAADSQRPAPSGGEHNQPNQSVSSTNNGSSKSNQKTSILMAPTLTSPQPNTSSNKSEHKAFEHPSTDYILDAITFLLFVAASVTAVIFLRQNQLASDDFIATHRPKIIVTAFDAKSILGESIEISFIFINAGESEAFVTGISYGIGIGESERKAPHRGIDSVFKPIKLAPGDPHPITANFGIKGDTALLAFYMALKGEGRQKLFLRGKVAYEDKRGSHRETGFIRVYAPETEDWLKVENSDYEYSY